MKPWIIAVVLGLAVGLCADVAVLNYQWIASASFERVEPAEVVLPEGAEGPSVSRDDATEFVFDGAEIGNMHVSLADGAPSGAQYMTVTAYGIDEGSAHYYELGTFTMKGGDKRIQLHLTGAAGRVKLESDAEDAVPLDVEFNVPCPFEAHPLVIAGCAGIALIVCLLRPSSQVYRRRIDESKAFLVALAAVLVLASCASTGYMAAKRSLAGYEHQYYELAEALADGHAYLNEEPSDELLALDNPYDRSARSAEKAGALWDHALYDGKYYVYFGALPCLVFFLPYYLLTGGEFPMAGAVIVTMAGLCLGMVRLALCCCRRWAPGCSQATLVYSLLTLFTGSWVVYAAIRPGHYVLPILSGLALLVWGLALCVEATARREVGTARAAVGAGLIAATVACRPQLLLGGVVALVLLGQHMREHGARDDLKALLVALVPVVAVLALQGWYNHVRFGSFLDFGANYNLTTNDMTKRGFDLDRTPLALLAYLFQPPVFGASAPFLRPTDLDAGYFGVSITENMFGGIFCLSPLLLGIFLPVLGRYRRRLGGERLGLVIAAGACALALVVFDANGAGILPRYFMDFGVFLAFGSMLCITAAWGPGAQGEQDAAGVPVEGRERLVYLEAGKAHLTAAGIALIACVAFTGIVVILNATKIGL